MKIDNLNNLHSYIEQEKIDNIDIRFLAKKNEVKSFSIVASNNQIDTFFSTKDLKFNNYILMSLNFNRNFLDPFLPHNTIVFMTNLIKDQKKIQTLSEQNTPNSRLLVDFFIKKEKKNILPDFSYSSPPFDKFRDFRTELVLSLKKLDIIIKTHYCGDTFLHNFIEFIYNNKLELLDTLEKIKYAILMVADAYNKQIDLKKGIFSSNFNLLKY